MTRQQKYSLKISELIKRRHPDLYIEQGERPNVWYPKLYKYLIKLEKRIKELEHEKYI